MTTPQSYNLRLTPTQAFAVYTILCYVLEDEHRDLIKPVLDQIASDADEILCVRCKEGPRTTRTLVCRRCYYRHQKRLKRNGVKILRGTGEGQG